jgi:predicted type IV restriction endonuclease
MDLIRHLEEIRVGIKGGRFPNEAAVSQGIVLRLLMALGWPTWDTQIVWPEYALEGRRVDFALCHPSAKPKVFIEVKQVGQSDGAEKQLFEYAFHKGVPIAILTDGREWHFFLPAEAGDYGERRVYKLDVVERETEESVFRLERYLKYDAVVSGAALSSARDDYRDVTRKRQISETLPQAWLKLVQEEDEMLIELIADRVESLCGYKPDPDSVATFLAKSITLRGDLGIRGPEPVPPIVVPPSKAPVSQLGGALSSIGFSYHGRLTNCRNARDVLVSVIENLADHDPTFIQRFVSLPKHGRTRRFIALNPSELYPGRSDLSQEHSYQLRSGYWLGTNVSRKQIERIISMACEVAGLIYDRDLRINLG